MIIAAMAYGTLMMKNKLDAAKEESEGVERAALSATSARKGAQIDLDKKTRDTEDLREYLAEWDSYLKQTKTVTDAERMFNQKVTQGNLTIFDQSFVSTSIKKGSTIPSSHGVRLVIEDDYHRLLDWIGSLESTLPTSRVTNCTISKGGKGNDVKIKLLAEVPLAVDPSAK